MLDFLQMVSAVQNAFTPIETVLPAPSAEHGQVKPPKQKSGERGRQVRRAKAAAAAAATAALEPPEAESVAPPPQVPEAGPTEPAPAPTRPTGRKPFPFSAATLLRDNGLRPPDWRWRLANRLAETGRPPGNYPLDGTVYEIVRFLRRGHQLHDWPTPAPSGKDWRYLKAALALYQTQSDRRTELEARILAGEDTAAIATKCGLEPAVIDTFHDVFFEIRAKLLNDSYVFSVIDYGRCPELDEQDRSRLLKYQAYVGGVFVLEELLWYFATPPLAIPRCFKSCSDAELTELRRWMGIHYKVLLFTYTPRTDTEKIRYAELSLHPWHRGVV
jgi:hypothetical protein